MVGVFLNGEEKGGVVRDEGEYLRVELPGGVFPGVTGLSPLEIKQVRISEGQFTAMIKAKSALWVHYFGLHCWDAAKISFSTPYLSNRVHQPFSKRLLHF